MKLKGVAITIPLAAALSCSLAWTQQNPDPQALPETSSKSTKNTAKEKHWTGSLVDVSCMAKTLASGDAVIPRPEPATTVPHFLGGDDASSQIGQAPGGGMPGGMGPGPRGQEPGLPTTTTNPDASTDERARVNQASRVDNAVKVCAASASSQTLGLAMSDGDVVQFDPEGITKAKEALKDADLQPGKKVKAKVTGTMEDKTTVRVAAVDIKGKGK